MKIKAVIMSHDTPKSTKALYDVLCGTFDVTVFNVGCSEGKSPPCPSDIYPNLFYTGCWRESMRRFSEYDVVWVIGGDVRAENTAAEYLKAITSAMPFGLWSPSFCGYFREVMSKDKAKGRVLNVFHLEGIATAISRDMMEQIGFDIPGGSVLGWGVDLWMSWEGWRSMRRNVLDGRVSMCHPEGCGYSREAARREMDGFMEQAIGSNWGEEARLAPEFGIFDRNIRHELNP
jgi:hypothetical protein